jgi:hypothetical protein
MRVVHGSRHSRQNNCRKNSRNEMGGCMVVVVVGSGSSVVVDVVDSVVVVELGAVVVVVDLDVEDEARVVDVVEVDVEVVARVVDVDVVVARVVDVVVARVVDVDVVVARVVDVVVGAPATGVVASARPSPVQDTDRRLVVTVIAVGPPHWMVLPSVPARTVPMIISAGRRRSARLTLPVNVNTSEPPLLRKVPARLPPMNMTSEICTSAGTGNVSVARVTLTASVCAGSEAAVLKLMAPPAVATAGSVELTIVTLRLPSVVQDTG